MKKLALALAGVILLTASAALADEPVPTPAPATSSTPLQTRPSKRLELAPQNEGTPVGYKLLAGVVVLAGAVVYAKKKKGGVTKDKARKSAIDLLARHSVGVRSELLVVDVEGTRLLVGMTPGSMSTLAVLQTPEGVVGEESPLMGEEKYFETPTPAPASVKVEDALEGRVRSLLEARKKPPAHAPPPASQASRVPGQAKGLLVSLQGAPVTKLGDW